MMAFRSDPWPSSVQKTKVLTGAGFIGSTRAVMIGLFRVLTRPGQKKEPQLTLGFGEAARGRPATSRRGSTSPWLRFVGASSIRDSDQNRTQRPPKSAWSRKLLVNNPQVM